LGREDNERGSCRYDAREFPQTQTLADSITNGKSVWTE